MKVKDTLWFHNITTEHPVLVKRTWFWHVTSCFVTNKTLTILTVGPLSKYADSDQCVECEPEDM